MRSLRTRVAGILALALVLAGCSFDGIYDLPIPGQKVSEEDGFVVSADFADALNVVPRSSVMVGDVPIGQVESVTRVGWHARVTMRVRNDVELPDNAEAQIRQTSLLGEKFVALSPPESGANGRLGPGDRIPMDSTGRNPEVEEVLGALSVLLSGGGVGQIQTITQELNAMMEGRTGDIRGVLRKLNTLVGRLDNQRNDIIQALDSINGLSKTLVAEKKTIGDALDAAAPAIKVLRNQHGDLVSMLTELEKLGEVGTRVVTKTKDDLIAELRHLEPVLRSLADTDDALVPGVVKALSYPFPMDAADTIHGDFANVVFKMQIKLTPVSEGGLLPETLQDVITLCRSTPLAPICAPGGEAVENLCSVLGSLPLCAQSGVEETTTALDELQGGDQPKTPVVPGLPELFPEQGGEGGGSGGIVGRLLGVLGGGSR